MALEKVDTKAFDDVLAEINNIKNCYEEAKDSIMLQTEKLLESWSGDAQHTFYVYYSSFKEKLTIDMALFDNIISGLEACKQAYIDTDNAIAAQMKSNE